MLVGRYKNNTTAAVHADRDKHNMTAVYVGGDNNNMTAVHVGGDRITRLRQCMPIEISIT